jgi:hypothetical protein
VLSRVLTVALILAARATVVAEPIRICNHAAVYDPNGVLRPWTSWRDAIDREMGWYAACPLENGYPRFVTMTFMDGGYKAWAARPDFIPAMQNGMGIISYLKYWRFTGRKSAGTLRIARAMGDFLLKEAHTPDTGSYPLFPRSTGRALRFPQAPDCGSQADKPYQVQPDKGAIAAYALVELYDATKDRRYLDFATHVARVLAANMGNGDATHSPWPFRVDYRTGEPDGLVAANQTFALRLFDRLLAHGCADLRAPREKLWAWIKNVQIPNAAADGKLWVQFFEDYRLEGNRNSWSALNTARYLLERKQGLDPDWRKDARTLIDFANRTFTEVHGGVLTCGEQDDDHDPWGGACSTWGGVLALYAKATGSGEFKGLAYQALTYCLYAINDDGCPRDAPWKSGRGGWQEDAHTDKIHNYIDAMTAFPEWARR